jgi:DnaJ-class molecular chaperone
MSVCQNCGGYGKINCYKCRGAGRTQPSLSFVVGTLECLDCKGSGEILCPTCEARGEILTGVEPDLGSYFSINIKKDS